MDGQYWARICFALFVLSCLLGGVILANLKPYLCNARVARQFEDGKWKGNAWLLLVAESLEYVTNMNGRWNLSFPAIIRGMRLVDMQEGFMPTVRVFIQPLQVPARDAVNGTLRWIKYDIVTGEKGSLELHFLEAVDLSKYSITAHFRTAYDPKETIIETNLTNHGCYGLKEKGTSRFISLR